MLACVVLLAPLLAVARGFGSGAPTMACTGMTPQHSPHSWQTVAAPFQLTTDSHTYTPGAPLRVTISGSRGFKGFMLQARSPFATSSNPVGAVGAFQSHDSGGVFYLLGRRHHYSTSRSQSFDHGLMPSMRNAELRE
ncbi:hypothetical protein Bbelb_301430 [Branchiostoma belcheri]|nr:hypothetical protein Bbelb_301430 [Branchiostoma belcheri]